jgi:micrococcal nuclease
LHEPALKVVLRRTLSIVLLAIGCRPAGDADARTAQKKPASEECTISRIADGDSLVCGSAGRIRLLMIDAPELAQGSAGRQAQNALQRLAPPGTRVSIETDVRARDDYDRILAYLYLPDGRMLNEEMARAGFATSLVYPPNVKYAERIRDAVGEARQAKRGLWATDFIDCSPRDYRAGKCGGGSRPRR